MAWHMWVRCLQTVYLGTEGNGEGTIVKQKAVQQRSSWLERFHGWGLGGEGGDGGGVLLALLASP